MNKIKIIISIAILLIAAKISAQRIERARDWGILFNGKTGDQNAITDVKGLEVGYKTLISGKGKLIQGKGPVRTGVTVILPKGKTADEYTVGMFTFNGNGEVTGTSFITDYGKNRGPIGITNTYSVGVVRDAIGEWNTMNFGTGGVHDFSFGLPIVGETFDGSLNDINGLHVKKEHVFEALNNSSRGPVAEGNVGGGTGMVCYWFKGGTGTASRVVTIGEQTYTVGVLVQANFGYRSRLSIRGIPIGEMLKDTLMPSKKQDGSLITIVATDAPLTPSQLNLVAKRVTLGAARTGTIGTVGSGDIFLALSTSEIKKKSETEMQMNYLTDRALNRIFLATVQATEEAIINTLVAAEDMVGADDNAFYAMPKNEVIKIVNDYNIIFEKHKNNK